MNEISVRVKTNGMVLSCRPYPEPDGYSFRCAECEEVCCRISFGIMNGFWRCRCGNEIEIVVDGKIVDLREYDTAMHETATGVWAREQMVSANTSRLHDEEFLKACGISAGEEVNKP